MESFACFSGQKRVFITSFGAFWPLKSWEKQLFLSKKWGYTSKLLYENYKIVFKYRCLPVSGAIESEDPSAAQYKYLHPFGNQHQKVTRISFRQNLHFISPAAWLRRKKLTTATTPFIHERQASGINYLSFATDATSLEGFKAALANHRAAPSRTL